MKNKLYRAFSLGIRPERKLEITKWARENVYLPGSRKSDRADLEMTPWLSDVLQTIIENNYDDVIFVASTGAGKSTLLEILTCYLILEKPSQTGIFCQTSPTAQVWLETRLLPTLQKNEKIKALFPTNRHHVKKDQILFPHMSLFVRGPSIANTQSLSLDFVAIDEAFIIENGAIEYISRRRHDRPFSQMYVCSQAGTTDSEWYTYQKDAREFVYHYKCPSCGNYHQWQFKNLKFDKEFKDVHYECPCGAKIADTPQNRRFMSCEGKYLEIPKDDVNPRKISFNFNAGLNFSIEWEKLAREFVQSNNAAKKFDFEPLQRFKNQRLSEWWDNQDIQFVEVEKSGYSLKDRVKDQLTLMAVDVQGQVGDTLLWFEVRTFNKDTGESKLLEYGRFGSYDDITRKQQEWNIPGNCVALDCAYKTDEVREFAARFGYLTLNGVATNAFPVNSKGKIINRLYGLIRKEKTLKGNYCSYTPYASSRVRMITAGLRSSNVWKIPHDVPDYYVKQLNSEVFEGGKWKQVRADNHALDCAAMLFVLSLIHGVNVDISSFDEKEDTFDIPTIS